MKFGHVVLERRKLTNRQIDTQTNMLFTILRSLPAGEVIKTTYPGVRCLTDVCSKTLCS